MRRDRSAPWRLASHAWLAYPCIVCCVACGNAESGGQPAASGGASAGSMTLGGSGDAGTSSTAGGGGATSGGAGNTSGSAGMAGQPMLPVTPNTCSEQGEMRTAPPAGLELYDQDAIDEALPFSLHWIGNPPYDPFLLSATSLTDIDRDGDLDFASAQRELDGEGGGGMVWWEYCTPDHWVVHFVGMGHLTSAAGNAMDVNEDGWMDLIAGDSWYENPKEPRTMEWMRHPIGSPSSEEIVVGDVGGTPRPEALYLWREHDPQFWRPDADPTMEWEQTILSQNRQQQGGAIGDLDGDGDGDWLGGYRWWYRNVDGAGTQWETVEIFDDSHDALFDAPLTYIADLDGDQDNDFAMVTHFGGGVAWAENTGAMGTAFTYHELAIDKALLHAVVVADFDNDGDQDIFAGQNRGPSFIFANDGTGTFTEHEIVADARMHEARVGDVDCDGDLDIAGKPWGRPGSYGDTAELRDHVYLQNLFVDNGGAPRFERGPYEEMHVMVGQKRACPAK